MVNISPTFKLTHTETGSFATLERELQQWWRQLPAAVHSQIWPMILAALIILGMLLAFHQVVSGAVLQSELRHKATAMKAQATWRCHSLRGLSASESCLLKLNPVARGDPLL